jgi:hypothetical protein
MTTRQAVEAAVIALSKARGEIDQQFSEAIDCLRSAATAYDHGDRAEAAGLLTAAADLEYDLRGDSEISARVFQALGLQDLAPKRGR